MSEERRIVLDTYIPGTLSGNHTLTDEFPFPVRLLCVKAHASNDSSATLGAADESANTIITAAAIGDSGDPTELSVDSTAGEYAQVGADTQIDWTLDYDGDGGTAAQNVKITRVYLTGASA